MAATLAVGLVGLLAAWAPFIAAIKAGLVGQVRKHEAYLTADPAPLAAELLRAMVEVSGEAAGQLVAEAHGQGATVTPSHPAPSSLSPRADRAAGAVTTQLRDVAAQSARSAPPEATADERADAVRDALEALDDRGQHTEAGAAMHGAMNTARLDTLRQGPVGAVYASEKNDANTCLAPEVAVTTRAGRIYAKDVTLADELLTHAGQWVRPSRITVSEVEEELTRIGCADGRTLRLTWDHPVLVARGAGFAWCNAGDLAVGDLVVDESTLERVGESGVVDLDLGQAPDGVAATGDVVGLAPVDLGAQRVPVRPVGLDDEQVADHEVSDPRADLNLRAVGVPEGFEHLAHPSLDAGLGVAGPVAADGAVPLAGGRAGDDAEARAAVPAVDGDGWAAARLGAVGPESGAHAEAGTAAPARDIMAPRVAGAGARAVVEPAGHGDGDAEVLAAPGAGLGDLVGLAPDFRQQVGVGELALTRAVDGAGPTPRRDLLGAGLASRRRVVRTAIAPTGEGAALLATRTLVNPGLAVNTRSVHLLSVLIGTTSVASVERVPYVGEVYDFTIPGDETFWAEGVLVHNCDPCHEIDGRWLGNTDQMAQVELSYPAGAYGGYIGCLGRERCRGTVVGVWREGAGDAEDVPAVSPGGEVPLRGHIASGEASSVVLGGGMAARTELVTFNDGARAVRKTVTDDTIRWHSEVTDAEDLASIYAARLGIAAPEVVRTSRDTVYMAYVDGARTGFERFAGDVAGFDTLADSPAGRRLALFDAAIGNTDRNGGNYLFGDNDALTAIDHGSAWQDASPLTMNLVTQGSDFMRRMLTITEQGEASGSMDYTPADVEHLRQVLTGMRPEFARAHRLAFFDDALKRLDILAQYARGETAVF